MKNVESKISLKWPLINLGIAGIAFSSMVILSPVRNLTISSSYAKSAASANNQAEPTSVIGLPVLLNIPSINVNAKVEYLGVTPQGAMDVPKGPSDVAWFDLGPRPGQIGSSVIAGHFGWKDGISAAFDNLGELQKGDKIYVKDENGATTTFVVSGIRKYDENQDASDVFYSSDGIAHLNLITCEGVWNKANKSYSNRVVVFTDEISI